jgi:hypothetical protein
MTQQEDMAAYAITQGGQVRHVMIGIKTEAQRKLATLAKRAYDALPESEREDWMSVARRASVRSGYEYFRQAQRWALAGPVEFTLGIKP